MKRNEGTWSNRRLCGCESDWIWMRVASTSACPATSCWGVVFGAARARKKLPDAVGFEARRQFPFPLDELRLGLPNIPGPRRRGVRGARLGRHRGGDAARRRSNPARPLRRGRLEDRRCAERVPGPAQLLGPRVPCRGPGTTLDGSDCRAGCRGFVVKAARQFAPRLGFAVFPPEAKPSPTNWRRHKLTHAQAEQLKLTPPPRFVWASCTRPSNRLAASGRGHESLAGNACSHVPEPEDLPAVRRRRRFRPSRPAAAVAPGPVGGHLEIRLDCRRP